MTIHIERTDDAFQLTGTSHAGHSIITDASAGIGGQNSGMRPMELLLHSLASCSAIDVINILKKQKQEIKSFCIDVDGTRKAAGVPTPFEAIDIVFMVSGEIEEVKLKRAIQLTKDKYCSVRFSLNPDISINYTYKLNAI